MASPSLTVFSTAAYRSYISRNLCDLPQLEALARHTGKKSKCRDVGGGCRSDLRMGMVFRWLLFRLVKLLEKEPGTRGNPTVTDVLAYPILAKEVLTLEETWPETIALQVLLHSLANNHC